MADIFILIALASLAIQSSYHSTLAYSLKDFLWLSTIKLKTIDKLSSFQIWREVGLKWLSPLAIFFYLYHKIGEAVNCQYCQGFWIGFLWYIQTQTIPMAIIYGLLTIIIIMAIEKTIL